VTALVNQVLQQLLDSGASFSSSDFARAAGVSRQAVHRHLRRLVNDGSLIVSGKARAVRYQKLVLLRQRVEVATAGSFYRLSARLLMMDVVAGHVTVDFTGLMELGDEFLEELFLVWAPSHPRSTLQVVHLPSKFAPQFFAFARRAAAQLSAEAARAHGTPARGRSAMPRAV